VILIDEHYYLDEQCSWISHLKLTSYCSGQTLYCIKLLLDCYRSRFDVLWNNWMTVALIYYLKWTVFASHHSYTEVTAHDWTLAGWCCVLSSQCMSVHPMIHQCHPDLFVKYLRKMHSSIILQRYGTNVIFKKTSLNSNTVRWWLSYIIMIMKQTTSLPTICSSIAHLYWCHKQWSLSTVIIPAYIYFNVPGCYYFSSIFAHRLEVHRPTDRKFCCRLDLL